MFSTFKRQLFLAFLIVMVVPLSALIWSQYHRFQTDWEKESNIQANIIFKTQLMGVESKFHQLEEEINTMAQEFDLEKNVFSKNKTFKSYLNKRLSQIGSHGVVITSETFKTTYYSKNDLQKRLPIDLDQYTISTDERWFDYTNPTDKEPLIWYMKAIKKNGKVVSLWWIAFDKQYINEGLRELAEPIKGALETSGEVYLVGDDGLFKSDYAMLQKDPTKFFVGLKMRYPNDQTIEDIKNSNSMVGLQKVSKESLLQMQSVSDSLYINENILGDEVYTISKKIKLNGIDWYLLLEKSSKEVLASSNKFLLLTLIEQFIILLGSIVLAMMFSKRFANPMHKYYQKIKEGKLEEMNQLSLAKDKEIKQLNEKYEALSNEMDKAQDDIEEQQKLLALSEKELEQQLALIKEEKSKEKALEEQLLIANQAFEETVQEKKEFGFQVSSLWKSIDASNQLFTERFEESFLFKKKKEHVSGDFLWFDERDGRYFIVLADCNTNDMLTTHYVLLLREQISYLIHAKRVHSSDRIMESLHKFWCQIFQSEEADVPKIQMGLCIIDKNKEKVEYAGANRPLLIVQEGKLKIVRGDHFSIGDDINDGIIRYTQYYIPIRRRVKTFLYLTTDGISAQVNERGTESLGLDRVKEVLLDVHQEGMAKQKEYFEQAWEDWKGNQELVDDATLLGFEIYRL